MINDTIRTSPYYTGPKQDEIEREAAATGEPIEVVARRLGAEHVLIIKHEEGAVTTHLKKLEPEPVTSATSSQAAKPARKKGRK